MNLNNQPIDDYCIDKSNQPSQLCNELENYTKNNVELPQMLIGKLESSFLSFLIHSNQVKRVLEIGTFTGYSALSMAEQLPDGGEIITLDINQDTVNIGKDYWNKSAHGNKIKSIIGPALESMSNLQGHFDLIFIDADKTNYTNYLKASLKLLSPTGIIAMDNCLWSGRVLDSSTNDADTIALQQVNDLVKNDKSLFGTLLPVRDGIFLVKKV
ncbi:hypothetical protein BVY03_02200 [bacterium K02(2017)]|nr:hypothetical protein BVY03_02200 [bacterium K02(2017)]